MDEIKWPKNETSITNFNNIIYQDRLTNAQELLHEEPQKNNFIKSNVGVSLTQHSNILLENAKPKNDSHGKLDTDVLDRIQQIVESTISDESRLQVHQILELVSALSSTEKLLLYLRLPTDSVSAVSDPLRQPLNPLGSRTEISQTINWIRTHLEEDPELSLPKQDVYEEYTTYCSDNGMKPLSTADFGKVMKQVYPRVRPRRLGTRGNSRYCYAGLRKRIKLEAPLLPDILDSPKSSEVPCSQTDMMAAASCVVREWAENLFGIQFTTLIALANHLLECGSMDTRSVAALTVINAVGRNTEKDTKVISDVNSSPVTGKHREMQIQLQRKIHQREVIREQKRKLQLQTPKCDTKRTKKIKTEHSTPCTSPIDDPLLEVESSRSIAECSNNYITSSNASSPQSIAQGIHTPARRLTPVCDSNNKVSVTSSTPVTTLPDFSSFHNTTPPSYNFPNNLDIVHDFSKKGVNPQSQHFPLKKLRQSPSKNVNLKVTHRPETSCTDSLKSISVKSFAKKSISRSSSYESQSERNNTLSILNSNLDSHGAQNLKINRLLSPTSKEIAVRNRSPKVSTVNIIKPMLHAEINPPDTSKSSQPKRSVNPIVATSNDMKNSLELTTDELILNQPKDVEYCPPTDLTYQDTIRKIQIPRLPNPLKMKTASNSNSIILIPPSSGNLSQKVKYKAIQPKPVCDNVVTAVAHTTTTDASVGGIASTNNDTNVRSQDNTVKQHTIDITTNAEGSSKTAASTSTFYNQVGSTTIKAEPALKNVTSSKFNDVKGNGRDTTNVVPAVDQKTVQQTTEQQNASSFFSMPHRERGISIGNMDKDALDDYLYGGNNSQEQEEEIMQYFQNESSSVDEHSNSQHNKFDFNDNNNTNTSNPDVTDSKSAQITLNEDQSEKSDKISQLRQLLEKNLKHDGILKCYDQTGHTSSKRYIPGDLSASTPAIANYLAYRPQNHGGPQKNLILPSLLTSNSGLNAKRRVSFDTHNSDSVPPSPNTRRKHFSFTPISPGPHSPGGKQSKSSSTNASPFVSPRNTPVPRIRTNCGNTAISSTTSRKTCKNMPGKLMVDNGTNDTPLKVTGLVQNDGSSGQFAIPTENQNTLSRKHNLPMSAPPSPMLPHRQKPLSNTNYLHTLLDSDTPRGPYTSNYSTNINEYIDKRLQVDVGSNQMTPSNLIMNSKNRLAKLKIDIYNQSDGKANSSPDSMSPNFPTKISMVDKETVLKTKIEPSLLIQSADALSREVSQFFPDDTVPPYNTNADSLAYRSQSVPLRQMKSVEHLASPSSMAPYYNQSTFNFNFMGNSTVASTCSSVGQTPVPNEFSDFSGPFADTHILNNENLDRIFDILDTNNIANVDNFTHPDAPDIPETNVNAILSADTTNQNGLSNMNTITVNPNMMLNTTSPNDIIPNYDNNLEQCSVNADMVNNYIAESDVLDNISNRNMLIRSQSIDFSGVVNQNIKFPNNQPSRSVPSTPLPYFKGAMNAEFVNESINMSKSHPSTPLLNDNVMSYKPVQTGDYLLNGQPVASKSNELVSSYLDSTDQMTELEHFQPSKSKGSMLSDNYVDEGFPFNEITDPVMLDSPESFSFSRDANDDIMQLAANTSENFATSTNEQQNFLMKSNDGAENFVAGSTQMK